MRLTRLVLERYGHVSGEWLELPPELGLHIVLGANEAGKSTALEAVADGLFGFPSRQRGRLHHPDDPRVGFTLQAADGTEASFVRRKTGRDKLLDSTGAPVAESVLARFLGGTGRERFHDVFGLDGERLRRAGRAIMAEQGEAGAAILQAQTGLRGLRETAERLDAEAKTLFGDGRGQRRISAAVDAIKTNRRLVAERSVSGADYNRSQECETALKRRNDEIGGERQALRAEQARLVRIRATAPIRAELREIADRLQALGPPAPLPPDAAVRYGDGVAARDQSRRDCAREEGDIKALEMARAELRPDPSILAEAASLTLLEADLTRIADARRDHLQVSGQAESSLLAIDGFAKRLGVPERGPALQDRLPDIVTRRTAERLLQQHAADSAAAGAAENAMRRAQAEVAAAEHERAHLPPAGDADALREAVDEVRNAGPIEAELARAAMVRDSSRAEADRLLVRLAHWRGDLAALEATSIPLEAEASLLGATLDDAAAARRNADAALAEHDETATRAQAVMHGIEAAGRLPTTEAIEALRARRDQAWQSIKRSFVDGGAAPTEGEGRDGRLAVSDLPALFENLLREADSLADARHGELARVQEWERQRAELARLAARRPALLAQQEAAQLRAREAQAAWTEAWRPAGVAPDGPAAMREWVRDRAAVLAAAASARAAAEAHGQLGDREARLHARLVSALPSNQGGGLAASLRQAAQALRKLDQLVTQHGAARERAEKAAKALAEARRACDDLQLRASDWHGRWAPVAQRLGLPSGADPTVATDLMATWSELDKALDRWRGLQDRLRDMRMAVEQHDATVAALAQRLGVTVTDTVVASLAERRRAADAVAAEQARLQEAIATRNAAALEHRRAEAEAEAKLETLRRAAGVDDDAGLRAAIAAAGDRAELTRRRHDRDATLRGLADGKTEAELEQEAATLDIDAIPGRLDVIAARTAELDALSATAVSELVQVQQQLRTMEAGQDVAGPAQAIQDSLAEIEDAADHYVRLRLAHALLRGGIDGYRRSQQGPLLEKASGVFERLTGGRYVRLEQDEGEKGEPFIVALRPDGSICPAGSLSEGTTDQLFLALRLASIALDAAVAEPLPFIADDLLVNFDDARAAAALRFLSEFGKTTQVILFTHHNHLLDLVAPEAASIHRLPRELAA